jgi:plastocyanin
MRRVIVTIAVVALLGALGAIGGTVALGSDVSKAGTKSVTIEDNSYTPHKFTISKNTIVKWTWASDVANTHNVTQADRNFDPKSGGFHSKDQTGGDPPYRHRFRKAGVYYLVCTFHPTQMRMKIRVK